MRTFALALACSATLPAAELISISPGSPTGYTAGTSLLRGISDDASAVLFESDGNPVIPPGWIFGVAAGVYLRDRLTARTRLLIPYDGPPVGSAQSCLSGDGGTVAYIAFAAPPSTADQIDALALPSGPISLVSSNSLGAPADRSAREPALDGIGRYVAFTSAADNLTGDGLPGVFVSDIFVKDRVTGAMSCASLTPDGRADTGECALPAISRNGRWVAFYSTSSQLVPGTEAGFQKGLFARDLVAGTTVRVDLSSAGAPADHPPYDLHPPAISGDGRYVAFASIAGNLVDGDGNGAIDVFVRDLRDGTTTRASVSGSGAEGDDASIEPSLSLDGRYVAFRSYAGNLIRRDTNGAADVFVRDRIAGTTIRVDFGLDGAQADDAAWPGTRINGLGFAVAYTSLASNLTGGGDPNGRPDVFLNANDPRFAASTELRLWLRTLIAWLRERGRDVVVLQRRNG